MSHDPFSGLPSQLPSDDIKQLAKAQFAGSAERFVASPLHRLGDDLLQMVSLAKLSGTERVLDVCDADESGFVVGGAASQASAEVTISPSATLDQAERLLIAARLRTLGSRAEVARSLGIGLRTLYTKLRAYGLAN